MQLVVRSALAREHCVYRLPADDFLCVARQVSTRQHTAQPGVVDYLATRSSLAVSHYDLEVRPVLLGYVYRLVLEVEQLVVLQPSLRVYELVVLYRRES